MAGEGGAGGVPNVIPVVSIIKQLTSGAKAEKKAEKREFDAIRAWHAGILAASRPVDRPDVARTLRPFGALPPVGGPLYATQPGGPPGTGSGTAAPPPPDPGETFLSFALLVLELLRRFGVRLPWDPKPIPAPDYGGLGDVYFIQPTTGFPSTGSSDFLSGLGALGSGVASVINAIRGPQAMPGGMSFLPTTIARSLPTIVRGAGSVLAGAGIGAGLEALFGGNGGCPSSPFTAGGSTMRASTFVVPHPETGRPTWFRPAGRPILWSSDLSACRRVRKVAGRARRRVGGR